MKNKFKVFNGNHTLPVLLLIMIILFSGLSAGVYFTLKENKVLFTVLTAVFFVLPWVIGLLWIKLFYVKVDKDTIEVRNMLGIRKSFDVKSIKKVVWRKNETNFGLSEKITIRSAHSSASVETLMKNFDKFSRYIEENVDKDIIKVINRNIGKKK